MLIILENWYSIVFYYRFFWLRVKFLFVGKLENVMFKFNRELLVDYLVFCLNVENLKFKEMRKRIFDFFNKFLE